jgi:hypothetical protein
MAEPNFDVDHHLRLRHAAVRITHNPETDTWLVSHYPDRGEDGYPGFTYSGTHGQCPNGPDLETMIAWVKEQPWESICTNCGNEVPESAITKTAEEGESRFVGSDHPVPSLGYDFADCPACEAPLKRRPGGEWELRD